MTATATTMVKAIWQSYFPSTTEGVPNFSTLLSLGLQCPDFHHYQSYFLDWEHNDSNISFLHSFPTFT